MSNAEISESTRMYNKMVEEFNKSAFIDASCKIQLVRVADNLILKIDGNGDKYAYQDLAKKAAGILNGKKAKNLIVDLTTCDRLFSSSLGMLGLLLMTVQSNGGGTYVVTKKEIIKKSFKIIGIDGACTFIDDIDTVLSR